MQFAMRFRTICYIAPLAVVATAACGGASDSGGVAESNEAVTACPTPDSTDAQERGAATAAFNLMLSVAKTGQPVAPVFTNTILASQRYRVQASGTGIEFDPNDSLFKYVTNDMKAKLAFAQLDATVAKFLSDGLRYDHSISNGWYFPSIGAVSVLANFQYPGPVGPVHIADNTSQNNSHQASASGQAWCGTETVTIFDSVQESYTFSPFTSLKITNPDPIVGGGWLYQVPAGYTGGSNVPTTPFNGPSGSGNPYLVVSVNGQSTNWANYNFASVNCWNNPPPYQCSGNVQVDPVPYAQPGAYYDTTGNIVGTQANPFALVPTVLYATPDHASQWATRTIAGVQQWGTFTNPISILGVTMYQYARQM